MSAQATFKVVEEGTGDFYIIDPLKELNRRQYLTLITTPEMMLVYAHHLKDVAIQKGIKNPAVYVDAKAKINARPLQQMIDPRTDLTQFSLKDDFTKWIVPFDKSY